MLRRLYRVYIFVLFFGCRVRQPRAFVVSINYLGFEKLTTSRQAAFRSPVNWESRGALCLKLKGRARQAGRKSHPGAEPPHIVRQVWVTLPWAIISGSAATAIRLGPPTTLDTTPDAA